MAFNTPPGTSPNDIPGNRCEDVEWERVTEDIIRQATEAGMCDQDFWIAWRLGLTAWLQMKNYGGKFPHEG